jgi:AcrR family transcriptional regulator
VPATIPSEPRRDRRRVRHEATKQEIRDAAWQMVRADGLNALSLRALARLVDMEPQSLYTYFSSKHAVYDYLFADGNRELLSRLERIDISDDAREALRGNARLLVTFATEDQARYELLFMRTIPDFAPSTESYAVAREVFAKGRSLLAAAELADDDFDLWTAIVGGLSAQQLANDPGGDRYLRLIEDAVNMFAGHLLAKQARVGVRG